MSIKSEKFKIDFGSDRSIFLICMSIALVFWVFVKLSKTYETSRLIYLEFKLPGGKEFVEAPPKSLRASFVGNGWDLMSDFLFQRNQTLVFDLANRPAEFQREELISHIEETVSVKVTDISRSYFSVVLDTTSSKKVPVIFDRQLAFAPDHFLKDSILVMPDSVLVSGPVALLDLVTFVRTEKMALSDLNSNLTTNVEVAMPDAGQLNLEPKSVEIFIPVEQFTEKTFTVPIQMSHSTDSIRIFPSQVEVRCVVGMSRYEMLTAADFAVEADFKNNRVHALQNAVPLLLKSQPAWVKSVILSPQAVEFFIVQ